MLEIDSQMFDKLKRKRASCKSRVTVFAKFIKRLENEYSNNIINDSAVYFDLEQRMEKFARILDEYNDIQIEIDQSELSDLDAELKERETFEMEFFELVGKGKQFLTVSASAQNLNPNVNTDSSSRASSVRGLAALPGLENRIAITEFKLPEINLKIFDGDLETWSEFRDTFESLINQRSSLSDKEKFHYLRSYITKNVYEHIGSLDYSSKNYKYAWEATYKRYNNATDLTQHHLEKLFGLEKIDVASSTGIRRILDSVNNRLKALKTIGEPTEHWDTFIIFLTLSKLDDETCTKWQEAKLRFGRPTLAEFSEFLNKRSTLLVSIERNRVAKMAVNSNIKPKIFDSRQKHDFKSNKIKSLVMANGKTNVECNFCRNQHYINDCPEFLKLNVNERLTQVKQRGLCINCLRAGHLVRQCKSGACKLCKSRHRTLLHFERATPSTSEVSTNIPVSSGIETVTTLSSNTLNSGQTLLSTVMVNVRDKTNKIRNIRALLDAGSQSSFITSELSNSLQLEKADINLVVGGINETYSLIKQRTNLNIQSRESDFSLEVSCLVIPQITGHLPNHRINIAALNIPANIKLADPTFNIPGKIDMLIGADYFWQVLSIGQIKLGKIGPILQKTRFGWIVAGYIPPSSVSNKIICHLSRNSDIEKQLERFWTIEEVPNLTNAWSREEEQAESHFVNTTKRDVDGKFIVSIPLKENPQVLGDSRDIALKRFLNLERKLSRNPTLNEDYRKFIHEYQELGHMVKVSEPEDAECTYYMPHHGVVRESSTSTKLRVVFDSSCVSTSGYSFNDLQLIGPTIQNDLFSILLSFRKHNFVIAGDIEKMYRMCKVDESQWPLQRILWRDNPNDTIETYELTTVTYGTSSAPFLAVRCLYQLGLECENESVKDVIKNQFYVDDMLSGGSTIDETVKLTREVIKTLKSGCFHLRKFVSNSKEVLQHIDSNENAHFLDIGANESSKTLGVIWSASADTFSYQILEKFSDKVTKRIVLSETSQVFDPLGLLSPTIIISKLLLRDLWIEKLGWDESLPINLHTRWLQFRNELGHLNKLVVARKIVCFEPVSLEIHGFSDASMAAYGACVYLKSRNANNETFVHLACAKSRVSPVRVQTVPRLELMAAMLMCKLVNRVIASLRLNIDRVFYWTDSSIVLGWIKAPINNLQIFVANRVAVIQELTTDGTWRHVPSPDNPADCVSRGVMPGALKENNLYWRGPHWLHKSKSFWPNIVELTSSLPEIKRTVIACTNAVKLEIGILESYSDLSRIRRIVAYCMRFKVNCLHKIAERNLGPLTHCEIFHANFCLIKITQARCFSKELALLQSGTTLDKTSKLSKLNPFVDKGGILRVGGRLVNSEVSYTQKHPIVLDSKDRFTKLLFSLEHKKLLHAGPQLLLANIRLEYWPLNGRNLARRTVHECVKCFRAKPSNSTPIMGNLPSTRVTPAPPFFVSGVDYAGLFKIKDRQGRGCKVTKAYVSVFICFTTRAIHLELVPSLSSDSFVAAFRRFISRRGKPSQMYSDNGTNFVGAYNELRDLGTFLQTNERNLIETFENEGISWSFIPSCAPHFGGLWEAGVKSMKHHLTRVASNALLTFEQFYTLLVQVEAILNSRPMYALSSDPSDLLPITPSHFLIGRPMTSIADPNLMELPEGRLIHYERIQQLQQHIWSQWSLEYISTLQERTKWRSNHHKLKLDELVVIKDDNLPPFRWMIGRIVSLHSGKDGVARVATVRTRSGVLRRPMAKICPLPSTDSERC